MVPGKNCLFDRAFQFPIFSARFYKIYASILSIIIIIFALCISFLKYYFTSMVFFQSCAFRWTTLWNRYAKRGTTSSRHILLLDDLLPPLSQTNVHLRASAPFENGQYSFCGCDRIAIQRKEEVPFLTATVCRLEVQQATCNVVERPLHVAHAMISTEQSFGLFSK